MGIEPTAPAWEAGVLPLYDARMTTEAKKISLVRTGVQCGKNSKSIQPLRCAKLQRSRQTNKGFSDLEVIA